MPDANTPCDLPLAGPSGGAASRAIVAIGGSAGSLQPLIELLRALPESFQPPLVWVTHLDPNHKSQLVSVLSRQTRIPVSEITDGETVAPRHIYVIPPNMELSVADGKFFLSDRKFVGGVPHPIDAFFQSVANEYGPRGIAVVLSGAGHDGTVGAKAVKRKEGLVLVQDPAASQHDSMPGSVIAEDLADVIGPPRALAEQLVAMVESRGSLPPGETAPAKETPQDFEAVIALIRDRGGVDFHSYKRATLERRVQRRMEMHGLRGTGEYLPFLRSNPREIEDLARDCLIHVTEFFRDAEAFEALRKHVVKPLVKRSHNERAGIRVWVVGCASGEEAYSIAMLIKEELRLRQLRTKVRVFATDVDPEVIEAARLGAYAPQDVASVPPGMLGQYFERKDDDYLVRRELRDCVTFAVHDVQQDPPFSGIDLISCRNVFIYFNAGLQTDLLGLFHRSLNGHGFVFLGSAETVPRDDPSFTPVSQSHRLYQKNLLSFVKGETVTWRTGTPFHRTSRAPVVPARPLTTPKASQAQALARKTLQDAYLPPTIVVDGKLDIVELIGQCHPLLHLREGTLSQELGRVIHEDLYVHVRSLILRLNDRGTAEERTENIRVMADGQSRAYNVVARRLNAAALEQEALTLVSFEETRDVLGQARSLAEAEDGESDHARERHYRLVNEELERELVTTKATLQSAIQDLETTNNELANANAELMALNEEYHCTSEELEVSREELESINEELRTLNEELGFKIDELSKANAELEYFLDGTQLAALLLDDRLRIFRYTPMLTELFRVLPSDVGRPVAHFKTELVGVDLPDVFLSVVRSRVMREFQARDTRGRWFAVRVSPYVNPKKDFAGLVVVFHDITSFKEAESKHKSSEDRLEAMMQSNPDTLLVLDRDGRVRDYRPGRGNYHLFADRLPNGKKLTELDLGANKVEADVIPSLAAMTEDVLRTGVPAQTTLSALTDEGRNVFFDATMVRCGNQSVLVTMRDLTAYRSTEERLAEAMAATERTNISRSILLANVSHELRTPLNGIIGFSELLDMDLQAEDVAGAKQQVGYIRQSAELLLNRVNEILDIAKLEAGKMELKRQLFEAQAMLRSCLGIVKTIADAKSIPVTENFPKDPVYLWGDEDRCRQVFLNLLSNALKFTPAGGKVEVSVFDNDLGFVEVAVADNGPGISAEDRERIFERFNTVRKPHQSEVQGSGLGLSISRKLVEMQDGRLFVQCPGLENRGSSFVVQLPSQKNHTIKVGDHAKT